MTKASDLRDQSIEDLEAACGEARRDLFLLRGEASQDKKMEKPHRVSQQRKEIARILTILHEKQTASGKSAI
jgi:large subunit ribosomal protein L29